MIYQRTLRRRVSAEGVGLHSGRRTRLAIVPAAPRTGLVFVRTDLRTRTEIGVSPDNVIDTTLATTLGAKNATVGTVEHLLSALYGLGIDNARIEVDGPEVPVMDGSAEPFVRLILEQGGIVHQSWPKRFFVIRRPIQVSTPDGRTARLEPAKRFAIQCSIDFDHPLISNQSYELTVSDRAFLDDICRARTFGFAKDVAAMHEQGFALGGSLDNAVVIDDFSVQNPEGLRYPDEFVRHKILDVLGDLALLGGPIIGRFVGHKCGHSLNTELVARVLASAKSYDLVEFKEEEAALGELELPAFGLTRLAPV